MCLLSVQQESIKEQNSRQQKDNGAWERTPAPCSRTHGESVWTSWSSLARALGRAASPQVRLASKEIQIATDRDKITKWGAHSILQKPLEWWRQSPGALCGACSLWMNSRVLSPTAGPFVSCDKHQWALMAMGHLLATLKDTVFSLLGWFAALVPPWVTARGTQPNSRHRVSNDTWDKHAWVWSWAWGLGQLAKPFPQSASQTAGAGRTCQFTNIMYIMEFKLRKSGSCVTLSTVGWALPTATNAYTVHVCS